MADKKEPGADPSAPGYHLTGDRTSSGEESTATVTPITPQITDLDQIRCKYDTGALADFLNAVFHTPVGHPLVWYAPRMGYPARVHRMMASLKKTKVARPLYYGTSSVHELNGELFNRRSQFAALHVVVLDDIGTKVKALPEALEDASYVIESSPGNLQVGYILAEPVRDLEAATALVQLLYQAGVSDPGGAIPTKLVRLPGGVNGKAAHQDFPVRLVRASERRWTPAELLEAAGVDVAWSDVLTDAQAAQRRRATTVRRWSGEHAIAESADGVVDVVLEWLYENGEVISENGHLVQVKCPQAHLHTNGDPNAAYFPLGRGDRPEYRGFNCFHGHCDSFKTKEYLSWVAEQGGPESSVYDPSGHLAREWVYDPQDDLAYQVLNAPTLEGIPIKGLKNLMREKVHVHTRDGKVLKLNAVDAWLNHPHKLAVYGQVCEPSTTQPLVEIDGRLRVNTFRRPAWTGEVYEDDIAMWENFLDYLCPVEAERNYFSDWLAAKFQDMSFRGCAILMIAESFGTGRGTLVKMLSTLFGAYNVAAVPWKALIGRDDFNEWQLKPLAVTHETLEANVRGDIFKAYESLKTIVETQPSTARVNIKRRTARQVPVYTSHLMFSNHSDALVLPEGDRRMYVVSNPVRPAKASYFDELYAWLEEEGAPWAPSVAHWLRTRPVDMKRLHAQPPMTPAKDRLIKSGMGGLDTVLHQLFIEWQGRYVAPTVIRDALAPYRATLRVDSSIVGNRYIEHAVARASVPCNRRASFGGRQVRVRVLKTHLQEFDQAAAEGGTVISTELGQNSIEWIQKKIQDILEDL